MGQNSSAAFHSHSAPNTPRDKLQQQPQPTPASDPPTHPEIPKIPNYAVPENRVLPAEASEQVNKRLLLRPVSQELSKFHPDFVDIFQHNQLSDLKTQLGTESEAMDQDGGSGQTTGSSNLHDDGKENNYLSKDLTRPLANGKISSSRFFNAAAKGDLNPKANSTDLTRSQSLQDKRANGHVVMNGRVSDNPSGDDLITMSSGGVHRTNSLDRSSSGSSKKHAHKRYPSATMSLANEASVIPEDPREHLYNDWRKDPFSNPPPSVISLPVHSSFQMDHKMNMTYAQLAELRRQKRLADKMGKKLSDLGAELHEESSLPISPFDRKNYTPPEPSAGSSTTGSSDTGVSTSKKRRAPLPPSAGGTSPDSSPDRFSMDVEPPVDYDCDHLPVPADSSLSPWKPHLSRQSSTASAFSRSSKGPAPQPPPAAPSGPQAVPSSPPPSSQFVLQKGSLFSKPTAAASDPIISQAKAELEKLEAALKTLAGEKVQTNAEEYRKGNKDTTLDKTKKEVDRNKETREQTDEPAYGEKASTSSADTEGTDLKSHTVGEDKTSEPLPLSSLLKHDIKMAEQARGVKEQFKGKAQVLQVKPKDPATLFSEELAKAASEREKRSKSSVQTENQGVKTSMAAKAEEGEEDKDLLFKSDLVKVKRRIDIYTTAPGPTNTKPSPPPVSPKHGPSSPTNEKKLVSKSEADLLNSAQNVVSEKPSRAVMARQRPPDGYDEEVTISTLPKSLSQCGILDISDDEDVHVLTSSDERTSQSTNQFSQDWKPEDDLDTDDEMMDDSTFARNNAVLEAPDGFKSSIIPSKMDDLKPVKRKSSTSGRKESTSSASTEERSKFGSIRKFQKNVHKSVRTAFGSISKASGKFLRRTKSQDLNVDSIAGQKYRVSREDEDHPHLAAKANGVDINGNMSESGDENFNDEDLEKVPSANMETKDKQLRLMKRTGVAYVGQKGQIVVLPEFETVQVDEEGNVIDDKERGGRAPRIFKQKKKKFTYESTVRKQQKDQAVQQFAEEIRQKDRQIELERHKQRDMEREFQRLRDLETQEKLQRLQTTQLQQQVNFLQQQQQMSSMQFAQSSVLSSNHPHQRYSVPEFPASFNGLYTSHGGLNGMGTHLPPQNMSSYTMQPTPLVTTVPSTTTTVGGYDVNYISNYMRMMGIQPPTTQQQWTYLLNSVNVNPHNLFDATSKSQTMLVGSAGPDLSHLFSAKSVPSYTDASAMMAQKASLVNILKSGQDLSASGTMAAAAGAVSASSADSSAVVTRHLALSLPSTTQSHSVADMSIDALTPPLKERSNPVYFSSDEEEGLGKKAQEASQHKHRSSSASSRSGAAKGRRRPQSASLPLGQSNVYRDVTSREEAGVTRVQVPDYRTRSLYIANSVNGDADDMADSSDGAEVKDSHKLVLKFVNGTKPSSTAVTVINCGGSGPAEVGHQTASFEKKGSALTKGVTTLPQNGVYGPIGYKPIAFTPRSPQTKLQTEWSVDR